MTEKITIAIPPTVTVKRLGELMHLPATAVIKELMKNSIMATINEEIDYDTATIISEDLGFMVVPDVSVGDNDTLTLEQLLDICAKEKESGKNLRERPPIVTILGHVDHGKTTLLDSIRKASVAQNEAGGITQHISAYQVKKRGHLITFIDTPGHAAFAAMRERGVSIADIAILVVAADDGVRPQTEEVIAYLKEKKIPTIIAINKIDKPEANSMRVKQELAERDILVEEWGGKVIANEISAKNNVGITDLLESILLMSDVEEFRADDQRNGLAVVLEAHMDPHKGAVATVVVRTGTLKIGQDVSAGSAYGRIRRMEDSAGRSIECAPPSTPVTLYGFNDVPNVNDVLQVMSDKVVARLKAQRNIQSITKNQHVESDQQTFPIIIKSDVQGSLEAIEQVLSTIPQGKISIHIIHAGIGNITESDIKIAGSANAIIYGFNVTTTSVAKRLADDHHITIKSFRIIYELMDDAKREMLSRLPRDIIHTDCGTLDVRGIFRTEKDLMIIGGIVAQGKAVSGAKFSIMRNGDSVGSGIITSLQQSKAEVKEVARGLECGMTISSQHRIKKGDSLSIFTEEVKEASLAD